MAKIGISSGYHFYGFHYTEISIQVENLKIEYKYINYIVAEVFWFSYLILGCHLIEFKSLGFFYSTHTMRVKKSNWQVLTVSTCNLSILI